MSHPRTSTVLLLSTLALGACFDPRVDFGDDATGSDSGEGSSEGSAPADGTEGPLDTTAAADAPPEIVAFTVNGSTMPAEQQAAGAIELDADAVDDVGVVRIDLYDGEEIVATVTEAPYRAQLLVSSADNGSHGYWARAYDDAGQVGDSEVVPLSVNVLGGAMLELREHIGEVQLALLGVGGPRPAVLPDGGVVVTGMARLEGQPELRTGLLARAHDPELSLLWSHVHAPDPGGDALDYFGFSAPVLAPSGAQIYVGGRSELESGQARYSVFSLDARFGEPLVELERWTSAPGPLYVPVAVASGGDLFVGTETAALARLGPDFGEAWHSDPMGLLLFDLAATSQQEPIVTFAGEGCAAAVAVCLRKLSSTGEPLWTRKAAENTERGVPTRPTVSSTGQAAIAVPTGKGTIEVLIHDPEGNETARFFLSGPAELFPRDIVHAPDEGLVIVGYEDGPEQRAWATHVRDNGTEIWRQSYSIGSGDASATGVAVSPSGRLYLTGEADRFDMDFLTHGAHAWVAEVAL